MKGEEEGRGRRSEGRGGGEGEEEGRGRGSPRRGGGSEGKKVSRCIAVVYTYVAFFMVDLDVSRCSFISSA